MRTSAGFLRRLKLRNASLWVERSSGSNSSFVDILSPSSWSLRTSTSHRCKLGAHDTPSQGFEPLIQISEEPETAMPDPSTAAEPPLAPLGLSRTFYKRELPTPPAVAFSSPEGQAIFAEALAAGTMQGFFRLIEQFRTQDEPAYCGLASVAMVLNSLAIDPRRPWKGAWRFFHEQMLDCCHPLEKVRQEGITLEQAACLAKCNGASVDVFSYGSVTLEAFRNMVHTACAAGDSHLIVSYSRKAFLQTGDGHFSPIGGYAPTRDQVLILDTARFKYPPHWVQLEQLYHAMAAEDPATGKPRGFMSLGLAPRMDSVLFTLDVRDPAWESAYKFAEAGAAGAAAAARAADATATGIIGAVAAAAPRAAVRSFLAVRTAEDGYSPQKGMCIQKGAIDTFLMELRGTEVYKAVKASVHGEVEEEGSQSGANLAIGGRGLLAERLTVLLLLMPTSVWAFPESEELGHDVAKLLDVSSHHVVRYELQYLSEQYAELPEVRRALEGGAPPCVNPSCKDARRHICAPNSPAEEGGREMTQISL